MAMLYYYTLEEGKEEMIEILEFIFASFWRWLGFVILLAVIADIPRGVIKTYIIKKVQKKTEEKK